jgi:hypothetical protein
MRNPSIFDTPEKQAKNGLRAGGKYSEMRENRAVLVGGEWTVDSGSEIGDRNDFGFRPSGFFRHSSFGLRHSASPSPFAQIRSFNNRGMVAMRMKKCKFRKLMTKKSFLRASVLNHFSLRRSSVNKIGNQSSST